MQQLKKKEIVYDIELSPKTRVSNKSQYLTISTQIKIPYANMIKNFLPRKLIMASYTDKERPPDLDSIQSLKDTSRESYCNINLSDSFIMLFSFKIEDGSVEMIVNHGTSKKKKKEKKRKIDVNNKDDDDQDDSIEGDCKYHNFKTPCQFKTFSKEIFFFFLSLIFFFLFFIFFFNFFLFQVK